MNIVQIIIAIIASAGIPSAIFGFLIRRLEKRWDKADEMRTEKENARLNHEIMMIDLTMASLGLAEATAEAVQRIPDANCNGEMTEALRKASDVQAKYKDFERMQTAKAIMG